MDRKAEGRHEKNRSNTTDIRCLRILLRVYFSEAFEWKNRICTFNFLYIGIAVLQVIKLGVLTSQMLYYGDVRSEFITAVHLGRLTMKHLLLENWDASWETLPYPPAHGEFAVYRIDDIESGINYAVSKYYNAEHDAAAFFTRLENDTMEVMIKYFDFKDMEYDGKRRTEMIKSEKRFAVHHGLTNRTNDNKTEYSYSIAKELEILNISEALQQMFDTTLEFTLQSVRRQYKTEKVLCLNITGKVHYNDKNNNGQLKVYLTTEAHSIPCVNLNLSVEDFVWENPAEWGITIVTIVFCVLSCLMSILMIVYGIAAICWSRTLLKEICFEYPPFFRIMLLDSIQFGSDACYLVGTGLLFKEYALDESTLDVNVIWLGLGCFLAWLSFIRYLKITESFSLLFETIYRAKWNVLAYLVCVTVLFCGFLFCGYVVLGPYHVKFKTLTAATETLFALIHGDEFYATFAMFKDDMSGNYNVISFGRLYLGAYIFLFTIVAINLLIALFNSAYDAIQNRHDKKKRQVENALEKVYNQEQQTNLKQSLHNLVTENDQNNSKEDTDLKQLLQALKFNEQGVTRYNTFQSFLDRPEDNTQECTCCRCRTFRKLTLQW